MSAAPEQLGEAAPRDGQVVPERPVADDLGHYVTAFKASSDHARYALFVVIIATVLVAIATYNSQSWSWPRRRIAAWYGTQLVPMEQGREERLQRATDAPLELVREFPMALGREERLQRIADRYLGGDVERLKTARDEYLRQFEERHVFNSSPIPGASIDINDLGILGGIALLLLMLVFAISMIREHENLRLALFKVRQLCSLRGERHADGNSSANLLYHSLAMSQVLSSPPTLARWQRRGMMHRLWIVFFLPAAAHSWTVWTDWHTREAARVYGAHVGKLMVAEVVIAVLLWGLSIVAFVNARAMTQRWERAFFHVNPHRAHIDQMAWWQWLKLRKPRDENWQAGRVITELVDTLREGGNEKAYQTRIEVVQPLYPYSLARPVPLSRDLVKEMGEELRKKGEASAKADCATSGIAFRRLERFKAEENVLSLRGEKWTVRGTWTYMAIPSA